jgi:hypothetical protein
MKYSQFKLILSFLLLLAFYSCCDNENVSSLSSNSSMDLGIFFQQMNYVTLDEKLKLEDRELSVSVHYIDETSKIFDQAIVYNYEKNMIQDYLVFKDSKLVNHRDEVLVDFSVHNSFFGLTIFFSYPTKPGYDIGFSFSGFLDGGKTPADPPVSIVWDKKEAAFYKFELDWDSL